MNSTTEKKTWTKALLSVDWRADRHTECHTIEFERPTKENPRPDYPVEKDKVLSKSRLPMSGEWGGLYDRIIVKDFDEYSLTFQYGEKEYTITPEDGSFSFGETGMSYTTFWLSLWLKEEDRSLKITHNEAFLRRFRTRLRVLQLTNDDVEALRNVAKQGDAYAQYGYGRWLYYTLPTESSMQEAEELFYSNRGVLPEAYAAYARMWQYGETTENRVDMDSCRRLMKIAAQQGSEWAELELTRNRIFGNGCEAEPEKVAHEIEEKLSTDIDPMWYSFLAYSYELMEGREEDVIRMYELSTKNGQWDDYYYLANIYKERGNMALYEELMEEGINRGSGLCCLFRADMAEEDFQEFPEEEQKRLHEELHERLQLGLKRGEGWCAYELWLQYHYGGLGYRVNEGLAVRYLKNGVKLGNIECICKLAELAEDHHEHLDRLQIAELWLKAVRYSGGDNDALRGLRLQSDPTFLLQHKEEIEKYWQPMYPKLVITKREKTATEPVVLIIWPSGHINVAAVDVYKMKSHKEMAKELIDGEGLDAVHYSPLLDKIYKEGELDLPLVMYCDRDAYAKNLDDNAIGTMLYGTGQEVRGPIIICQEDSTHDCHSFKTTEDIITTYRLIDQYSGGLLIMDYEDGADDGRWDAWT